MLADPPLLPNLTFPVVPFYTVFMSLLIAFEKSGAVRDAFISLGVPAVSCDIEPSHSPGPHIQADFRSLDLSRFRAIIAFPPCTFLCKAGAWMWPDKQKEQAEALSLVEFIWNSPALFVSLENPAGYLNTHWRRPSEIINPWWFGHPFRKETCLWLRGFPPLMATLVNPVRQDFVRNLGHQKATSYLRSRTFSGIASAMASQWRHLCLS